MSNHDGLILVGAVALLVAFLSMFGTVGEALGCPPPHAVHLGREYTHCTHEPVIVPGPARPTMQGRPW